MQATETFAAYHLGPWGLGVLGSWVLGSWGLGSGVLESLVLNAECIYSKDVNLRTTEGNPSEYANSTQNIIKEAVSRFSETLRNTGTMVANPTRVPERKMSH